MRSSVAALLAGTLAAQAVQLDGAFEGGNLDGWAFDGSYYTVNTNNAPGQWQWLCFRVTGAAGQALRFRTNTSASGDVYRSYHRMVWRHAGEREWRFMSDGQLPGDGFYYFHEQQPFRQDTVYIAYWQPCTQTQLLESLAELWWKDRSIRKAGSTLLDGAVVGSSFQGRPLLYYRITAPSAGTLRSHFVFVARQHGYESLGNHVLDGMARFLISEDPVARRLCDKGVFHFYPLANPDAVWNGWTREGLGRTGTTPVDFNRDWQQQSSATGGFPSASLEIDALRIDILLRTGGRAALLLDVHSHAKGSTGLGWYWWAVGDQVQALNLVTEVWRQDGGSGGSVYSWPAVQTGGNSTTAMNWGAPAGSTNAIGTLGGVGLTLEPIAAPFGSNRSVERIRGAGVAILRAIDRLY